MLTIFWNNWNRVKEQKMYVYVSVGLTVLAVVMAVFFTQKLQPKMNLAVVNGAHEITENNMLQITNVSEMPALSELVQNRYDAVLYCDEDGQEQIWTIKNDVFIQRLHAAIENDTALYQEQTNTKKVGSSIVGYMMMFLLMQGIMYARLFAEYKEKHLLERIAVSSLGFYRYLAGHVLFSWILIVIPSFFVIVVTDVLGFDIGFTLMQYAGILSIAGLMSTCFALCLNSFFNDADTANMVGNSAIVMTTVLSGAFVNTLDQNSFFYKVLYLLPQKGLLNFIGDFEEHILYTSDYLCLIYVIICSIVMLMIGVSRTRQEYCANVVER